MNEPQPERTVADILVTPEQRTAIEERLQSLIRLADDALRRASRAEIERNKYIEKFRREQALAESLGISFFDHPERTVREVSNT